MPILLLFLFLFLLSYFLSSFIPLDSFEKPNVSHTDPKLQWRTNYEIVSSILSQVVIGGVIGLVILCIFVSINSNIVLTCAFSWLCCAVGASIGIIRRISLVKEQANHE